MLTFQETDLFTSVNFVIPGSLLPFKKEIVEIFRKEKTILFRKQRYAKVFRDISIEPIFSNRRSIKKFGSKNKDCLNANIELMIAASQTIARSVGSLLSIY